MESHLTGIHAITTFSFDMRLRGIEQNENDAAIISSLLFLMDSNIDHNSADRPSHSQADTLDDEECSSYRLKYAQCGNVSIQDLWKDVEEKPPATYGRYPTLLKATHHQVTAEALSSTDRMQDPSVIQKKELQFVVPSVTSTGAEELGILHHLANDCSITSRSKRIFQNIAGTEVCISYCVMRIHRVMHT